jgi:adenylate cyclase
MAKIEIITAQGQSTEHELGEYTTIGRHPDNELQLLDRIVSKEHAVIYRREGQYYYRDLGSLNGSYQNNQRISEVPLSHQDAVTLGSTKLVFVDEEEKVEVNIESTETESHIRAKMDMPTAGRFLPEDQMQDDWTLRSDYERLRIAYEIQHSIGGVMDVDVLLNEILDAAFNFLKADRGVILLFGEDGQLRPRVSKSLEGAEEEKEIGLSSTIINSVISDRTGVLSSDAMMDSRFKSSKSIMMQGIRSSMAVPIMCRGELLGMMYLDSKIATGAFSEKDLNIFSAIAQQAGALLDNIRQARKLEQEALTREKFSRLLSPNLVEELVSGSLEVTKGGMYRNVTILFADIRGFTSLTERSEASEIVEMLNEYFERMVEIIFSNEGTLDKFIGDEIMVLWGSPVAQEDHALRAVRTAWEMQRELDAYNVEREQKGQKPMMVGIGICSGDCVVGYMGSTRKMEYTSIGDPVNTASRLCDLAGPMEIVIAAPTYKAVASAVRVEEMPPTPVKGKAEPLQIFRVVGLA